MIRDFVSKIKGLLFGEKAEFALRQTRKIKVGGILFTIKRLDTFDYLKGYQVLIKSFGKYEDKKIDSAGINDPSMEKVKKHYKDVFMSGVVKPKLSIDGKGENIHVDEIFSLGNVYVELYNEIINFTYGKKKTKLNIFQDRGFAS